MNLPDLFLENMKSLLGDEFPAFLDSYNDQENKGLRVNRLKISQDEFLNISPFELKKIPYVDNGFVYGDKSPAKDAYYHAGLYYLQEPSAMLPADRLPVDPGDKVLDLCAAPGGKSTELLGKLNGTGLLYANDISASRAASLLKNIELTGAKNYYVTAEKPENLADRLPEFFDKILCDVPCSGEGMFRKDPALIATYVKSDIYEYQKIQREILSQAYRMLKPGGYLMYSTCTFNTYENEENIAWLLDEFEDMELADIEWYEGFREGFLGLDKCVRVFPHRMMGEGHFLALMKKRGDFGADTAELDGLNDCGAYAAGCADGDEFRIGSSIFRLPVMADGSDNGYRKGLRYLRTGLFVGDERVSKKGEKKIEYSQSYAMTIDRVDRGGVDGTVGGIYGGLSYVNLTHDDERVNKYLKGETIFIDNSGNNNNSNNNGKNNNNYNNNKGYTLILVDGFPLGFAKSDGFKLKNMYNPAWRMK